MTSRYGPSCRPPSGLLVTGFTDGGGVVAPESFGFMGGEQLGHAARQAPAVGGGQVAGWGFEPACDFFVAGECDACAAGGEFHVVATP